MMIRTETSCSLVIFILLALPLALLFFPHSSFAFVDHLAFADQYANQYIFNSNYADHINYGSYISSQVDQNQYISLSQHLSQHVFGHPDLNQYIFSQYISDRSADQDQYVSDQVASLNRSIWFDHERGWFWYERIIEPEKREKQKKKKEVKENKEKVAEKKKEPEKEKAREKDYVKLLLEIRQSLEQIRARAILFPTPENVAAWLKAQLMITKMAGRFTQVAALVPVLFPELDIARQLGGKSQWGTLAVTYEKNQEKERALKELAENSALVLIYRSPGCHLCVKEAEEIKKFASNYPFKTYSFYEGEPPEGIDRARPLTVAMEEYLGVTTFPTLYLFKNKQFYYIGAGFLGQQDIKRRILALASQNGWLNIPSLYLTTEKELSPEKVLKILKVLEEKGYQEKYQEEYQEE